ncbi:MAG: InlB B-repeat-containing protein [Atopobiaceae bacterium]|nr:InlB B-repeat-containing protein [Atopobiaceae bacterium]
MVTKNKIRNVLASTASVLLALQLLGTAAPEALAEMLNEPKGQVVAGETNAEGSAGLTGLGSGESPSVTSNDAAEPAEASEPATTGSAEASEPATAGSAEAPGVAIGSAVSSEPTAGPTEAPAAGPTDAPESVEPTEAPAAGPTEAEAPSSASDATDQKTANQKTRGATQRTSDEPAATEQQVMSALYIDENGGEQTIQYDPSSEITEELNNEQNPTLASGTYVLASNVGIDKRLNIDGQVSIILFDDSTLTAQKGVHLASSSTLKVFAGNESGPIVQSGELNASASDNYAGIGGNNGEAGGELLVYGAHVVAQGGQYGAGIGGGKKNDGGTVFIRGEKTHVEATGGYGAAGIGGGCGCGWDDNPGTAYTGNVTIESGTVEAQGGEAGAGIGGGNGYGTVSGGGTVTISGGMVTATGGSGASGIGGSNGYLVKGKGGCAYGADVFISGGKVVATSRSQGAGIGPGCHNNMGGFLTITGGEVIATCDSKGENGPGIGCGYVDRNVGEVDGDYPVTITGGTVKAQGARNSAGIGGGLKGNGVTVTISGTADVEAIGGFNGAGIGSGDEAPNAGLLHVSGGKVVAKGGGNAAGIGSGQNSTTTMAEPPTVIISGGEVYAYGNSQGAGIGGGEYGAGGNVTITGGKVYANGHDRTYNDDAHMGGAGIGSGCGVTSKALDGGALVIEGNAEVEAIGGLHCAGIGGGKRGDGAEVTIRGNANGTPTVKATGGQYAAGIGGGWEGGHAIGGAGGVLTIENGNVVAIGGERGAGIGGGANGEACTDVYIAGDLSNVVAVGGLGAAGIGGGAEGASANSIASKDGGPVSILGGTVTVQAGAALEGKGPAEAIGHASGATGSGTLSLYDLAKVVCGDKADGVGAEAVAADKRVEGCRKLWAKVTPCDHKLQNGNAADEYIPVDDDLYHTHVCGLCLVDKDAGGNPTQLDHDFGTTGLCVCDVEAHKVSFDANAGDATGTMDTSDWVIKGKDYSIPASAFTRTGYDFAGWNTAADGTGAGYADKTKLTMGASDVTLYAQWTAHTYKVAFDKNAADATGTMAEQGLAYGAEQALTKNAFTRTGYSFSGWNTVAAPSEAEPGTPFSDEQAVKNLTDKDKATVTLYAQWAAHAYKVAFDKNASDATGSTDGMDLTYDAAPTALTACGFSRTGYDFAGWNTVAAPSEAEPGESFSDGQAVKNLTDKDGATVTLHAQWRANAYKVAFDANAADATGTMAEQRLAYGADPVALPKNAFSRKGHAFAGWNTKADGKGDAYPDGARVADLTDEDGATVTLYAQWRANTYTVSFDVAGGSAVASQKVTYGKQAKRPANPKKGAWTFGGWYSDAALKSAYDFAKPVTGNLTLHAKWNRTSIAKAAMAKVADQAYTAKAITPKPAVKLGSKTLKAGTDFAYSYKANVRAGTATVTATGKGAYSGSASRTFRIVAPAGSATATLLDGRRSTAALGKTCGTVGKSMTMTSLAISLARPFPVKGGIEYRTHVQTTGWEKGWKRDGAVAGNPKAKKRLEGIQVRLYGDMAKRYDVYYRAHVQRVGWMAWAKNGASAGSQSGSRRMEAVQVVLVPKGQKAPANAGASTKAVFVDWSKQK